MVVENDTSLSLIENGEYFVTAKNIYGCLVISDTLSIVNLSAFDLNISNQIQVYPNPFNNLFHVEGKYIIESEIFIYDNLGQIIMYVDSIFNDKLEINGGNWADGIYYMLIRGDGYNVSKKVIKKSK